MADQRRGRSHVRARTVRRAARRAELKQADRAEQQGRRVPPTIAGFETALRDRGYDGVAEALISRHNQRMQRVAAVSDVTQRITLPLLTSYVPLSFAAEQLGADPGRPPMFSRPTWPDHLSWGLDSVAAPVRLLLALQPIGATIIARTQLERWSSNLESTSEISQEPGEDTAAWFSRLWSQPAARPLDGVATPVGDLFADLSELLHGRGPLMALVWLDVADIDSGPSAEHAQLLETIGDVLTVGLSQLRECLTTAALERGWDALADITDRVRLVSPADGLLRDPPAFVWPMIPQLFQEPAAEGTLGAAASGYRRVVSALRADRQPDQPTEAWPVLGLGYQRFRALLEAQAAFDHERRLRGEQFDQTGVDELATEAVLAGEMAAMLAIWLRTDPHRACVADALAVCASGLRSSQWLWLEDDDRAMGCLRCVIEQLARARTWRTKPDRAAKIEGNTKSTPRDWVQAAGWRRLSLLHRALSEFAHGSTRANWSVARDALVALQTDADTAAAKYTGRTHALTASIFMLSAECAAWVDSFGSLPGDAYRKVIRVDAAQADRAVEALMARAWEKRATPVR
jgi:hypothetical protein